MAEQTNGGSNYSGLQQKLTDAIVKMRELEAQRRAINEEMGAIRANIETAGIPRKAFAAALQYLKLDADKREGFDFGYAATREAGGLPIQASFLDDLDGAAAEAERRAAALAGARE